MKKTFIVLRNELITTIKRKSFILTLLLLPLIGLIISLVIGNRDQSSGITSIISRLTTSEEENLSIGLLDETKTITEIPDELNDRIKFYSDKEVANLDLDSGMIKAFYFIPGDYVQKGEIVVYRPDFNSLSAGNDNYVIERLINSALLSENPEIMNLVNTFPEFKTELLTPEPQRDPEHQLTFFLPYIVTFLFYIVILGSSSMMLNSITNEKSNRVIEILLTSITPMQLLSGKIVALGLVGLLQTIVWSGTGLFILRLSGRSFAIPQEFQLPTTILAWGIIFFILGYILYASLMAGVGALVSNLKEASQATTILVIPMVIPLVLLAPVIQNPNGALAVFLSLFPFTSPVSMMTRLSAGNVPFWQILLAIILLLFSAYWIVRSVSGFFRAQYLLSGKEFKVKYFIDAMLGKL
jgi:ABC-2 type transport system permease protein